MNIHKRGIALSGRFCRLEHPSNTHTHTHHPRKKTSTSSTNLKPNTTHGRRQVPQVRTLKPKTEEDKYLKYKSETKNHPRKKTSTSSTNLKPNTTQGRRQVPQVQIGNQTPPTEEDKYIEYESETKHHPRRKTSTQVRIRNQNTKKEDEDSETQETCSEDSKHTNCDSGTHGIQEENSSTLKHQKRRP